MNWIASLCLLLSLHLAAGQIRQNNTVSLSLSSLRVLKDLIIIPSSQRLYILAILPVHFSDSLECGAISEHGIQSLTAFVYALHQLNRDQTILPGHQLGAVIFDSCSSEYRTIANIFELFGTENQYGIGWQDIIAVVQLDQSATSDRVENLFRDIQMPRINVHSTPVAFSSDNLVLGTAPSDESEVKIMAQALNRMQWTYVNILYDNSNVFEKNAQLFELYATSYGTCVGNSIKLDSLMSLESAQLLVRKLLLSDARVVVLFISDRNFQILMNALYTEKTTDGRFLFVTAYNERWIPNKPLADELARLKQGLLTISPGFQRANDFSQELSSLTLQSHSPIPDNWFDQFWQQTFRCTLNNNPFEEPSTMNKHSAVCSGAEYLNYTDSQQSYTVLPTILAVQSVGRALENFMREQCPGTAVQQISDCFEPNARTMLASQIKRINFTYVVDVGESPLFVKFDPKGFLTTTYVIQLFDNSAQFEFAPIGVWHPAIGLSLEAKNIIVRDSRGKERVPKSVCYENCNHCSNMSSIRASAKRTGEERSIAWTVVYGSISGLGVFVCLICVCYFRSSVSKSGYIILAGLVSLYILAFIWILNTSATTCTFQKMFIGVVWAMIFAPLLVQSIDTWRLQFKIEKKLRGPTDESSLFMISLGLVSVQAIVAAEWAILQSPTSLVYLSTFRAEKLDLGSWRCAPGDAHEKILLFSSVYVAFLALLCSLFSLLTWNADNKHNEGRWVFGCSILTIALWSAWGLATGTVTYSLRDPITSVLLIVNATLILMCLFVRKAYIGHRIRKLVANGQERAMSDQVKLKEADIVQATRTSGLRRIENGYVRSQSFALASTTSAAYMYASQGYTRTAKIQAGHTRQQKALPPPPNNFNRRPLIK